MYLSRRSLFAGLAGTSLLGLAGCAGLTAQQVAQKVVTDVELIANGFAKALPALTLPSQYASAVARLAVYMKEVVTISSGISASLTKTAAQPVVAQIIQDINAALGVAAALPLPPPIQQLLVAASILVPVLESGVGLPVTVSASRSSMTPAQARDYLKSFKG